MKLSTISKSLVVAISIPLLLAQQSNIVPLNISQAVDRAVRNYPSIQASEEQVNAAIAGIRQARTNYLPSVNALAQVNRATRNNVFGLLFPQSVIPAISGPVLGTDNGKSVWGSAFGVLVSWEPFDFGRRRALVQSAHAVRNRSELTEKRTQFEVATATAAAFLTLVASQQTVRAAQAAVDRAQVLVRSVTALTNAQLRPGADLSRANTELDAAQTQFWQAEQSVGVGKTALAQYTGADPRLIETFSGNLLSLPGEDTATSSAEVASHPVAKEQSAVVQESQARLRVLQQTYRPTFELQLGGYARGTGALVNGSTLGSWNGLGPNYFNAAAGFTVNIPVMALPSIRAQEAQEAAIGRSAEATSRRVLTDLQAQVQAAQATLIQARRIAEVTPKEVADARAGFEQTNAQYRSGLTTMVAVAEAQKGFAVLPWRWRVERTFAWLCRNRRLRCDYGRLPQTTEALIYVAMIRLMTRRLATS